MAAFTRAEDVMLQLFWLPLVLQVVVPVGLLLWLALARQAGYAAWLLTVGLAAGYAILVTLSGLWLMLPACLPTAYAVLLLVAAAISLRRIRAPAILPRGGRTLAGVALRAAGVGLVTAGVVHAYGARREPPGTVVDAAFPLRGGTYLVVNGGSVKLLNAHLETLAGERFRPYRGQSRGVDLVRVDDRGRRASGMLPRDPAAYLIFGDTVVAPCAGRVLVAEDGHPDMPPPRPDRSQMAGNHVIVDCQGAWIVLAHLQRGSVRLTAGDLVREGDPLGVVGNSGNSGEPHLHVHAQRPGTYAEPLGGEPLLLRLGGRYLVRNERMTSIAPPR